MRLLIGLWVGWCTLHSLLIAAPVSRWFETRGGAWHGLYRLGYVAVAVATLVPLLWYTNTLPQQPIGTPAVWVRVAQSALFVFALTLFAGGARVYDLRGFLGLRQWQAYRAGRPIAPPAFTTSGILRSVRHPWYSGGIALLWALPDLTDVSLTVRSILSLYLVVGAWLEERKLLVALGEPYRIYCRQVPMFIPWKRRH